MRKKEISEDTKVLLMVVIVSLELSLLVLSAAHNPFWIIPAIALIHAANPIFKD